MKSFRHLSFVVPLAVFASFPPSIPDVRARDHDHDPSAPRFSFHELPPSGVVASKAIVNGTNLLRAGWMGIRDPHCQAWQESLDRTCSRTNAQPFLEATDRAFDDWKAAARKATSEAGASEQSSCESTLRMVDVSVRSRGNRDDRVKDLDQRFNPWRSFSSEAERKAQGPLELADFKKEFLALQPGAAHRIAAYRKEVCDTYAGPGVINVASVYPAGATLVDLAVAAETREDTGWLCSPENRKKSDAEIIDQALERMHRQVMEEYRQNHPKSIFEMLKSPLFAIIPMNTAPGGEVALASMSLLRQEAEKQLGKACPLAFSPDEPACACRIGLSVKGMERELDSLKDKHRDRLESLREKAKQRYFEMIDQSALSAPMKKAIHDKYDRNFPPMTLAPDFTFNGFYSRDDTTGSEEFALHLSTLNLPDETILEILDHENGHFFAYSIEAADLQGALQESDIRLLRNLSDCADRSVAWGEFLVERREKAPSPAQGEQGDRVMRKRDEALGDIFIRGHRKLHPWSSATGVPPGETIFCEETDERVHEIQKELLPPDAGAPPTGTPIPTDPYVNDEHSRPLWRIPWLAASRDPSLGETSHAPRGARCEDVLWK